MKNVICFGEVLFDCFSNGKSIGGAPLNVGLRLKQLGLETTIISRVGNDIDGEKIISFLQKNEINTDFIQVDKDYSTGIAKVALNPKGSATYDILNPSAWDNIEYENQLSSLVSKSDALVYGSLSCRNIKSKETLFELLKNAKYKVFDVNLRAPFYNKELLHKMMLKADFIKLNDDELYEIAALFGSPYSSMEKNIKFIATNTNTNEICVTKGRHGAVLLKGDRFSYHSGFRTNVVDTVGAGDAFLASLLYQLLENTSPTKALEYACAVGAIITSQKGATKPIKKEDITFLVNPLAVMG